MSTPPTIETYPELQRAFSFFNEHLFDNKLSSPLFVLESNIRYAGHFTKNKFVSADGKRKTHQVALNPVRFHEVSTKVNLSTLVHEMCHQYQVEHGKESRRSYHDKQWAQYMIERGLIPSHTGLEGGKQTGQSMRHYIESGGRFDVLADRFIQDGFSFAWHDPHTLARYRQQQKARAIITSQKDRESQQSAAVSQTQNATTSVATPTPEDNGTAPGFGMQLGNNPAYDSSNRVKYVCLKCTQQCWGRRGLKVLCGTEGCDKRPLLFEKIY